MRLLQRRSRRPVQGLDIGLRSNGRRLVLPYPKLPHILIAGLTGSGKSGVINSLLYALAGLQHVALVGVDLKRVELAPWRSRFTALEVDGSGVDGLFGRLRGEIERREQLLESLGERAWRTELGPWLVFIIDEFAELTVTDLNRLIEVSQLPKSRETDQEISDMMKAARHSLGLRSGILESFARKCRALGVTMTIATQYPTSDVVDTQVRSQFEIRLMCRVASKEQVKVGLGGGMEESFDVRDISPLQRGSFAVAGLETKLFTARASWIDDATVAARVAETAHLRIAPEVLFGGGAELVAVPVPAVPVAVDSVSDDGALWL
ncbi:MAG: FtsK/SpoIIIE domain-containing protein [Acidimicrobiales bacterium]